MKWLSHLRTVQHHRFLVLRHCWRGWIILAGTDARFEQVQSGGVSAGAKILSGQPQPERDRTPRKGLQRGMAAS